MKLTILGSGTFMPQIKRHASGYLLEIGKEKLNFDFGRGTLDNLLKAKINIEEINTIFLSHLHADHFGELPSLLAYVLDRPDAKKYPDTKIYGPKGTKKAIAHLIKANCLSKKKYLNKLKIFELFDKKIVKEKKWKLTAYKVIHEKGVNALAYRVESGKKTLCYSGDSSYCSELKNACSKVDLAILEATAPESWNLKSHMSGIASGKIAKEAGVKELVLTHVASSYVPQVIKDAKKYFQGRVRLAKDLMEVKIK